MSKDAAFPLPPDRGYARWVPGIWVLRHYRAAWFPRDLVAGLVLTAILVPTGMGYAEAAGLNAITGLYATVLPLLAYALLGPSRVLVLGPDSSLVALIAAAIVVDGDPTKAADRAAMLALLTGVFSVVAGLAKAGFVTDLLSKPVRVGYMNGIGLTVLVMQAPKLFGISAKADGAVAGAIAFGKAVIAGKTNVAALVIGAACLVFIIVVHRLVPRLPGVLAAVVAATVAVVWLHLADRVSLVGNVPSGLPRPALPRLDFDDLVPLLPGAIGITLVSFADTTVLSRTFAARRGERVDANRELVGLGAANLAAGFFRGFPISSSSTRTAVADAAGSKTQVTGLVAAAAIVVLLVSASGLVKYVPNAALAASVISAALRIFDFEAVRVFYRVRRSDFLISLFAFAAVAGLGVIPGIAVSVVVSLLDMLRRVWHPYDAVLGRAEGVKGYHDITRYPNARQVPGLILFRWDAPLFFANADVFRRRVLAAIEHAASPVKWVVITAEPITDIDTTAAEMIDDLDVELAGRGVELAFAEMKDPVKDRLRSYGLQTKIGSEHLFPTIGVAVRSYLERTGVAWEDWEDEGEARPDGTRDAT